MVSASTAASTATGDHDEQLPSRVVIATMAGIIPALLLSALDNTIVGTAMPQIIAELQGFEHYAAVTTVYMLAATVVLPIAGKLSDLYGRKPFLLAGVAIFILGSVLCGAAPSMLTLVSFRGLQGIGAGLIQGMAFVTIADLFPPARRGRVSGIMGAVFGFASVVGPAVGGFLTDGPGWRWCFYVNIPIGAVAFVILLRAFPHLTLPPAARRRIDWAGAATLVLGVVPVLLALSWGGNEYAWHSATIALLLGGGGIMTGLFIFVQARVPEGIMPLSLFRNRIVWASAAASTLMSLGMFGTTLFIPLFIQGVLGRSATESGAILTPMMVSMIAASMLSGQAMTRRGRYRTIAIVGVSLTAVGLFLLSQMTAATTYLTVMRNMIVVGAGLGMNLPVFTVAVQNAVDVSQVGIATSAVQFLRSVGGALGAALFGAVLTNRFGPAFRAALPADVVSTVPSGVLSAFENPQALMDPSVAAQMRDVAPGLADWTTPVLGAVKTALETSLHDVFLMGALFAALGLVFAVLLVDIPLRRSNLPRVPSPEAV